RQTSILPFARIVVPSLFQKLRCRDDRFHQTPERIPIRRQPDPNLVEGFLVRKQQAAPQSIREELATEVIDIIPLPLFAQILAQTLEPISVFSIGEGRTGLNGPSAEVLGPTFADRPEVLEDQADRIETAMAASAALVVAVPSEQLRQCQ